MISLKSLIYVAIAIATIISLRSSFASEERDRAHNPYKGTVEGQASAFFPQSNSFRKIYGNCGPTYRVQLTRQFASCWEFWSCFNWYSRSSRHYCHCCHSTIKIPNLSLGLNYLWKPMLKFDAYLGVGPIFGIVFLDNYSCCGYEKTSALAGGGILRGAVRWYIRSCMFVSLFMDYSYQIAFFRNHPNVGGAKLGGGVGFRF